MQSSRHDFASDLERFRAAGLERTLHEVAEAGAAEFVFARRRIINFGANDYLGLSVHPAVKQAAVAAVDQWGVGAGAARLLSGTRTPHCELEDALAAFKGVEAVLTFSCGYTTALGILPALAGPEDVVILDKLSHACLIDGARLSRARLRVFAHNHIGKLEGHLAWARENQPSSRIVVITESIFSMDGDAASLTDLVTLRERYGALLFVDEAHATGVVGPDGRGLCVDDDGASTADLCMGTLSKALGVAGGFVAGSRDAIDYLVHRARSFVFSTAPPPAMASAALAALKIVQAPEGAELRGRLFSNVKRLVKGLPQRFAPRTESCAGAIVPLHVGNERRALNASRSLQARGFYVPAIRYPTVPRGAARLRACLSAAHTADQIDRLLEALHALAKAMDASSEA